MLKLLRTWVQRVTTTIFLTLIVAVGGKGLLAQQEVTKEIGPIDAPFEMTKLERPGFQDTTFNVVDFGAQPMSKDSSFKNTDAIHRAIEAAHNAGGGMVLIPKGDWLTGPIHLMSNINLFIADGATLYFSTDKEDYLPVVPVRYEGVEAYNYSPLIYAYNVKNVAVTGTGTLDAQGDHWWNWFEEHGAPPRGIATQVPLSRRDFGKGAGNEGMRPNFMVFWKSEDILVEGITLNDSPMWNVHLVYSKKAIVRNITVNSLRAPNGDGVVLDSSQDVLVEYNHFETGDDAVVLKSGFNEESIQIDIPTKNIIVRNFEARNVRTGSGGIVFGSETSGGINNVYVHDAYFEGADRGIRFKTERGRGNVIENIYIRDIEMKDIENQAINFNTFYTGPEATGPAPLIRNVDIRNVTIDGVPTAISLIGLPEKWLENIVLQNIQVTNAGEGARIERVKNLTLRDVSIASQERAMIVDDSYEVSFENVSLTDSLETASAPLLIRGEYSGSMLMPDLPLKQIELGDGVSLNVIKREPEQQVW
ncbi:glycoside hydrolase family 28 protein [Aliifodinibius sp. S!AR15-10]|uniref:glycoside hydrolase family 28 protein n=1 Tax=Aliifodinibius sp. S!AR15-10 TaxID=2950437 RepID=UPI00285712D2|nr:glycoside hydrolase family 28 protein [Aliifodinibius sp. S!AR15-10]MDR8390342.1 glycoside hydrolase family 28 protein [Aliifodinibius sp. S!AR15-10]